MRLSLICLLNLVLFFSAYAMDDPAEKEGQLTIEELIQKIAAVKEESVRVSDALVQEWELANQFCQQWHREERRLSLFDMDPDSLRYSFMEQQVKLRRVINDARIRGFGSQVDGLIMPIIRVKKNDK